MVTQTQTEGEYIGLDKMDRFSHLLLKIVHLQKLEVLFTLKNLPQSLIPNLPTTPHFSEDLLTYKVKVP